MYLLYFISRIINQQLLLKLNKYTGSAAVGNQTLKNSAVGFIAETSAE